MYLKRPFGGPEYVVHYLGRYTHRVAISNHRLVSFSDGQITFRWRDLAHHNEQKLLTLSSDEFLRRFLLHILPKGFVRIRNFGFLANRKRAELLPLCFHLFGATPQPQVESHPSGTKNSSPSWRCPKCGGPMRVIERFTALQSSNFVLLQRSPLPHEALSPTRKRYTLRRANYFSVSLPNRSFLAPSSTTTWAILCPASQFSERAVSWVAPHSTVSAHRKLTPSLN